MFGGDIGNHSVFEKILSIGYEFETSSLMKLSMNKNKDGFIVSDLTLARRNELFNDKKINKSNITGFLILTTTINTT
jgi:hypothetical protein